MLWVSTPAVAFIPLPDCCTLNLTGGYFCDRGGFWGEGYCKIRQMLILCKLILSSGGTDLMRIDLMLYACEMFHFWSSVLIFCGTQLLWRGQTLFSLVSTSVNHPPLTVGRQFFFTRPLLPPVWMFSAMGHCYKLNVWVPFLSFLNPILSLTLTNSFSFCVVWPVSHVWLPKPSGISHLGQSGLPSSDFLLLLFKWSTWEGLALWFQTKDNLSTLLGM